MTSMLTNFSKDELITELEKKEDEIRKLQQEFLIKDNNTTSYKELFFNSPTPMWEEEITELILHLNKLKKNGVNNFNKYFESEANVKICIEKIKILNINNATISLHKAKSKEHLIKNFSSLFTDNSLKAFKNELIAIANNEVSYQATTEAKTFDNTIINLRLYLNITKRIINKNERYFSLISTIDITKQTIYENEIKANEKALRLILDTSQDVALLVDTKGFIIESNKACQDLFGVTRIDMIGRKLSYFAEEASKNQHTKIFLKAIKEKNKVSFRNKAYGKQWITTISPLTDKFNKVEKLVIFHRDITKEYINEQRIKESENKYRTIFNNVQTSIIHIDTNGIITEVNDYHVNNIGMGKLPKEKYIGSSFVNRDTIKKAGINKNVVELLQGKPFKLKKVFFPITTRGTEGYFNLTGTPVFNQSQLTGAIITVEDVTQQIISEQIIKESEEKFKALAENAPVAISIFKNAEKNDFLYVNSAWIKLSGYSRKELANIKPIDFVHPEMREFVRERAKRRLAGENEPTRYEIKAINKKGETIWIDFTATVIEYNNEPATLNSVIDITNQKNTEKKLKEINKKLRNLSKYINKVREEERKNIAREIHDNLGQKLTALNLNVSYIQEKIPDNLPKIKDAFSPITELIEKTIKTVQKLSTELRPGILDDLGLNNAIQWQTNEVSSRTSLKFKLDIPQNEPDLDEEIKIALFRVYQEALTNIIRHAQAKTVSVILKYENKNIKLNIKDDGIGISKNKIDSPNSFGIIGIKERISAINGEIEFINSQSGGTILKIVLPYEEVKK